MVQENRSERQKPRVAFLGTGTIGGPMAARLLETGFLSQAWNRTSEKVEHALQGRLAPSLTIEDAVQCADYICLCLTDARAVRALLDGKHGLTSALKDRTAPLIIDFTSSSPEDSLALAATYRDRLGGAWLDAPVSGGPVRAAAGELIVYCGGDKSSFDSATPIICALSSRYLHVGPQGSGQAVKLCAQLITSPAIIAIAEALVVARACGLDPTSLPDLLSDSLADSSMMQLFGRHMVGTGIARIGAISTMLKDVDAAIRMAHAHGLSETMADRAARILRALDQDAQFDAVYARLSEQSDFASSRKPDT